MGYKTVDKSARKEHLKRRKNYNSQNWDSSSALTMPHSEDLISTVEKWNKFRKKYVTRFECFGTVSKSNKDNFKHL